ARLLKMHPGGWRGLGVRGRYWGAERRSVVVALKGDTDRLKDSGLGPLPLATTLKTPAPHTAGFAKQPTPTSAATSITAAHPRQPTTPNTAATTDNATHANP